MHNGVFVVQFTDCCGSTSEITPSNFPSGSEFIEFISYNQNISKFITMIHTVSDKITLFWMHVSIINAMLRRLCATCTCLTSRRPGFFFKYYELSVDSQFVLNEKLIFAAVPRQQRAQDLQKKQVLTRFSGACFQSFLESFNFNGWPHRAFRSWWQNKFCCWLYNKPTNN